MQILKGFVTINQYINNTPGVIAPLGELSTMSSTYSKDKGEYFDTTIPGYKLVTFRSVDNTTGEHIPVELSVINEILSVVEECVSYANSHIRPYNPEDFRNTLITLFFEELGNVNLGSFVDNGSIALPEWISWTSLKHNNAQFRIWLADTAFAEQYDETEILIIPPIDNLNDFFTFYTNIESLVADRTLYDLSNQIQTIKNNHPETFLRMFSFDYISPSNSSQVLSTDWTIVIYGKAGDNIDAIKDALIDYILEHSTHDTNDWLTVFPSIFTRTEFTMLPRWDKTSIPNLNVMSGLYGSIIDLQESINFTKTNISFYSQNYMGNNVAILPFDYKAIMLLSIPGENNIEDKKHLTDIFNDYIPVPTSSLDFNRMTIKTREWVLLLEQLLIAAETATEFTSVPINFRRITKGGVLFISMLYDNINYLVAAKSNNFYQLEG